MELRIDPISPLAARESTLNPSPSTVLIVDDDSAVRELCSVEFKRSGFEVLVAENGDEAIRVARQTHPEIVILDLIMPGSHGFEVLKTIRQSRDLSNTVVIIRSGKSYKPDIDKALELGADAYVVKPGDLEDLVRLASQHLEKRRSAHR